MCLQFGSLQYAVSITLTAVLRYGLGHLVMGHPVMRLLILTRGCGLGVFSAGV